MPIPINSIEHDKDTIINIPFNHEERSSSEAYELAENRLKNINKKSLLFLDSIREINWSTPKEKGHYYKESEPVDDADGARRVLAISESPKGDSLDEYLIFSNSGEEGNIRREEVAYKISEAEEDSKRVEPVKRSNIVVFFPTNKDTYLDFLVQGPYKTTPNREDIPLNNEKNKYIIKETSHLVSKSLSDLKKIGLLNVEFLRILPLEEPDESKNQIYKSIYRSVSNSLRQKELLPTTTGGYVSANEALLAGPKSLTRLLDSQDIEILFDKSHWLDTGITRNRTPLLWDYLRNELDVEVVSFERFARNITDDFLSRKSDRWMTQFYAQLRDQKNLWDKRRRSVLRRKPIIRTKQGEHRTPFEEDDTPRFYLPIEQTSGYPTVKPSLIEDNQSRDFLKEDLDLEPPDLFSELREHVLPRYEGEDPDRTRSEYFRDLSKMVTACLDSDATKKKRRLVRRL